MAEVLAQRDALYRETAHYIVDASATPDEVVTLILNSLSLVTAS